MVYAFASDLAERFTALEYRGTFLLMFDGKGNVTSMNFMPPPPGWHEQCKALEASETSYLFYDPFDPPEHTWISWDGISQAIMERVLKSNFSCEDFVRFPHATTRSGELQNLAFPESWGVMF